MTKIKIIAIIAMIVAVLLSTSCSDNPSEPTVDKIKQPIGFYKVDVKTSFQQKMDITGAKNGFISFMEQYGALWCKKVEIGEDYEFWIKNPIRKQNGNKRTVTVTLDLKEATTLGSNLIKTKTISVIYDINDEYEGQKGYINSANFAKMYKSLEPLLNIIPYGTTVTNLVDTILPYLNNSMTDGEDDQQKAEAIIVGLEAYRQYLLWFNEIEAAGN